MRSCAGSRPSASSSFRTRRCSTTSNARRPTTTGGCRACAACNCGTRRRYEPYLPGRSIRNMLTAFVLLYADPARIASLGGALAAIDGVTEVYSVTGDEDLLVVVRVADHDEIARIVTEEI